jgi:hypothetical protein
MRWLSTLVAATALFGIAGCGNIITIPDQGVVVIGCMSPSYCFLANCDCYRKNAQGGACTTSQVFTQADGTTIPCAQSPDPSECVCPAKTSYTLQDLGPPPDLAGRDMKPAAAPVVQVATQCLEVAQACVGRGVVCPGSGARCLPSGSMCTSSGGDPPELVPTGATGPALEPHCQFVDDVCCPGALDGGV